MIRKYRDKQMRVSPMLFPMENRPKAQRGLHTSESIFDSREHHIDFPYFTIVQINTVGPQNITPFRVGLSLVRLFFSPYDILRDNRRVVGALAVFGDYLYVIEFSGLGIFLLQPAYNLNNLPVFFRMILLTETLAVIVITRLSAGSTSQWPFF
jgi:hypothetical protein